MAPPTLVDAAARALPSYLRTVWREVPDPGLLEAEAAEYVPLRGLAGRVGVKQANLAARRMHGSWLRLDCLNNPEFWLELNVDTLECRGRVPDALYNRNDRGEGPRRGTFVARRFEVTQVAGAGEGALGQTIRVDHTAAPAFWLELAD